VARGQAGGVFDDLPRLAQRNSLIAEQMRRRRPAIFGRQRPQQIRVLRREAAGGNVLLLRVGKFLEEKVALDRGGGGGQAEHRANLILQALEVTLPQLGEALQHPRFLQRVERPAASLLMQTQPQKLLTIFTLPHDRRNFLPPQFPAGQHTAHADEEPEFLLERGHHHRLLQTDGGDGLFHRAGRKRIGENELIPILGVKVDLGEGNVFDLHFLCL